VPKDKKGNPPKGFQIRDKIKAEIVHFSQKDTRIGLSIGRPEGSSERDVHRSCAKEQKQAMSNLRELLIEKRMNSQPQILFESQESDK
jgi:ribosomal protein S1